MDPLTLGIGAVGLGLKIFGGMGAANAANQAYGVQKQITGEEQDVNLQRQQQMVLSANRQQLENFRNTQRARAQGINAAVGDGAQYGSGTKGAQAGATDQGLFNSVGINQNLQIGQNIFGIDSQISANKMQLSNIQSTMATDQSYSQLGGTLMSGAGTMSNIFGAAKGMFSNGINVPGFNPIAGVSGQ